MIGYCFEIRGTVISIGDAVYGGDTGQELVLPLEVHAAVHLWIPIGQSAHVQSVPSFRKQGNVDDVLEVFVGVGQFIDYLKISEGATYLLMIYICSLDLSESYGLF